MKNLVLFLLVHALAWTNATAQEVKNTSYVTSDGQKVLRHEVVIEASIQEVWEAVTTEAGWKTWATPIVEIDLKPGGKFHTHYNPTSQIGGPNTIYNTVLSYVPREMLSIKINLNESFPAGVREDDQGLFFVFQFQDRGNNGVRAVGSMIGWGTGTEWDETYAKFDMGNEYTFRELFRRFKEGPVDWSKKRAPARLPDTKH